MNRLRAPLAALAILSLSCTKPNAAPEGMARIPGGAFTMGCDDPMMRDAQPKVRASVDAFWMDKTEVTNEAFARFVQGTGHKTVAEQKPDPREFPGVPVDKLVAGAIVFRQPQGPVSLADPAAWWAYVPGADWRHPDGPGSDLQGREKHPVVQVAWQDAAAYCEWAGKRLPSEAEWEFAERGGHGGGRYAWGDELTPGGRWLANLWQGHFPDRDSAEDGFHGTAPVAAFPAEGYGLYDMSGNVWEWVADWYRPDSYARLAAVGGIAQNPKGPGDGFDPAEPGVPKRVTRGGSFLCSDQYCSRYVLGARGKEEPGSGTSNLGFRCARSR
jgi:sulfatase modifying factor 1